MKKKLNNIEKELKKKYEAPPIDETMILKNAPTKSDVSIS